MKEIKKKKERKKARDSDTPVNEVFWSWEIQAYKDTTESTLYFFISSVIFLPTQKKNKAGYTAKRGENWGFAPFSRRKKKKYHNINE